MPGLWDVPGKKKVTVRVKVFILEHILGLKWTCSGAGAFRGSLNSLDVELPLLWEKLMSLSCP